MSTSNSIEIAHSDQVNNRFVLNNQIIQKINTSNEMHDIANYSSMLYFGYPE